MCLLTVPQILSAARIDGLLEGSSGVSALEDALKSLDSLRNSFLKPEGDGQSLDTLDRDDLLSFFDNIKGRDLVHRVDVALAQLLSNLAKKPSLITQPGELRVIVIVFEVA